MIDDPNDVEEPNRRGRAVGREKKIRFGKLTESHNYILAGDRAGLPNDKSVRRRKNCRIEKSCDEHGRKKINKAVDDIKRGRENQSVRVSMVESVRKP